MNEITTSATKAKTAKHMRDSFGLSKNAMPQLEVPADFREMIDKGVAQARDAYAKAKAAGEEAADLLKTTYATAAKGATGYNLKLIEIARANAGAAFDYAHELLGVKSPSEFIALSTAQMRKQFDIASAQNKELFALAQQVATEAAEPIKTGVSKALNRAI
jgi:phasin